MIVDNADAATVMFNPIDCLPKDNTTSLGHLESSLSDYIPQVSHGSVVITSRSRDVAYRLTGRTEDILMVMPMDVETSVSLLRNKVRLNASDEDVVRLVQSLDCMPLAITQAAAYIGLRAPRMTVSRYMQELSRSDTDRLRLLQWDVGDPRRNAQTSNSIITTWYVSFAYIQQAQPSAANLLALMSFFDYNAIPAYLLYGYVKEGRRAVDFEDDIDVLRGYCLVGVRAECDSFNMHQLVQFSIKKWLEQHGELQQWQEQYIDILWQTFPVPEYENWATCKELFPHAEAAVLCQPTAAQSLTQWATILHRASGYAKECGRYNQAAILARESVTAREKVLGKEHLDTLASVNNLAVALQEQGQYEVAKELVQRAIEGYETVLGKAHPLTLASVSNLALIFRYQGQYGAAEEMNRRVVEVYEKVYGTEHYLTLRSVNNLAGILRDQGQYDAAEQMNRHALDASERALGEEHPFTLTIVCNLAMVLKDQGQYKAAEEMHQRALEGRERTLGKEHLDTLASANNLASVLRDRGQYDAAEEMNRRVVEGYERMLGKEHSSTLICVNNLAQVLADRGQFRAAEEMNRRALEGRENKLGDEHPDTLTSVNNLALVLRNRGQYEAAERMSRRAFDSSERVLGGEHPFTLKFACNLAMILGGQGQYEAAEELNRRALEGFEKVLGKAHPKTLTSVFCLASLLHATSQFDEALLLFERACVGYQMRLGNDHPTTKACEDYLVLTKKDIQNLSTNASRNSGVNRTRIVVVGLVALVLAVKLVSVIESNPTLSRWIGRI